MKKKLKRLSDEELEDVASRTLEVLARTLEKEGAEVSLGTVVLERTAEGGINVKIEVHIHSYRPSTPSLHEKVARVIDATRKVLERELFEEGSVKRDSEQT